MNNARRKKIQSLISQMRDAYDMLTYIKVELEDVASEEQSAYESLPEGIQCSDRGDTMSNNVDILETAANDIDSLCDELEGYIGDLEDIE